MENKTFIVPNISCSHCVHTVESEVGAVPGVRSVEADEKTRQVTVRWESPATWAAIEKTLAEIDYPPQK